MKCIVCGKLIGSCDHHIANIDGDPPLWAVAANAGDEEARIIFDVCQEGAPIISCPDFILVTVEGEEAGFTGGLTDLSGAQVLHCALAALQGPPPPDALGE